MTERRTKRHRQSWQEAMELARLPPRDSDDKAFRYMGTRAGWMAHRDLVEFAGVLNLGDNPRTNQNAAHGGHAYCQAGLAACRAMAEIEKSEGVGDEEKLDLHTIHGYFSGPGWADRASILEARTVARSRLFTTFQVLDRQPTTASQEGDHFPISDASLPLAPVCLSASVSFKLHEPDTGNVNAQEPSPQIRYADILDSRPPSAWPPSPLADIDGLVAVLGRDVVGTFPAVDMKKVDMTAFNAGKPLHERRELILYRLLHPLPVGSPVKGDAGAVWDANSHVLVHAYEADRNGLLMVLNNLGFGATYGRVASLSYSFVMHVSAAEAVMDVQHGSSGERTDGWWVQEVRFPRAAAGRAIVMSLIWSPTGLHVATGYQDGISRKKEPDWKGRRDGKEARVAMERDGERGRL